MANNMQQGFTFFFELADNPSSERHVRKFNCEGRRRIRDRVLSLVSKLYKTTWRTTRDMLNWQGYCASDALWGNWQDAMDYLGSNFEGSGAESRRIRDGTTKDPGSYGVMLTWQTMWGRSAGDTKRLFDAGVAIPEIAEACCQDPQLQTAFAEFSKWVAVCSGQVGFEVWQTSMELNSDTAEVNRVHLHAFMCRDWKFFKSFNWLPRLVEPKEWDWRGIRPHVKLCTGRKSQNPQKSLIPALYYLTFPQVGSVFRDGNRRLGWDQHPEKLTRRARYCGCAIAGRLLCAFCEIRRLPAHPASMHEWGASAQTSFL